MQKDKLSVQGKIGILMILAIILLSTTFYLSYRSLSKIVSSIPLDISPENSLIAIRDISMDLKEAENSIRIYAITRDTQDIKPYYNVISRIDEKVNDLYSASRNDPVMLSQLDTISRLIKENMVIWNELLHINNSDYLDEYLNNLSNQLDSISNDDGNSDRGFLRRIFGGRNEDRFDELALINNLNAMEQQSQTTSDTLMARESQLASTSREISAQFYDLIVKLENDLSRHIQENARAADMLANNTYKWLGMFTVSGALLTLLILYVVVRYVRKTYAYQAALELSKKETEKLAEMKERFVADMTHEIRTPVTAISGFTEQLLHNSHDENTNQILKIIKSSSDHLKEIINDILDFSRLQNNKLILDKVPFDVKQVVREIHAMFILQAKQKNISFTCSVEQDIPSVLVGDPYRLKQIVINLVGNAVKFTEKGSVTFNVKPGRKKSEEIELILEITDTGIGIEENKLNAIFDEFTQAETSTSRIYGGTGLGLPIVKKLVQLHQGSIDCKSQRNIGTRITCCMPFKIGDEKQLPDQTGNSLTVPVNVKKLRILVVDDERYNRLLLGTIFERWGCDHSEAENADAAFGMLKKERFDLLLMDIRMPGLDGIKATEYIRRELDIDRKDMAIIGVTAAIAKKDVQNYLKAGMNDFLPKPFTEEMLLDKIISLPDNNPMKPETDFRKDEETSRKKGQINISSLYHISGGDEEFIRSMIQAFIDTTENGLEKMTVDYKAGNLESVADTAHRISSPCRHIGASDLYNNLKKIEAMIRNHSETNQVDKLLKQSLRDFHAAKEYLSRNEFIHNHLP